MSQINPNIFRPYDVRGLYPAEINPEAAFIAAQAFAKYLTSDVKVNPPFQVVLGQDMRGSSPFLAREVVRAFNELGVDVIDLGLVPTPAFYHVVAFKGYAAGVMVTASHMTREYNGLKFCVQKAYPVATGSGLEKVKAYALAPRELTKPAARGRLISFPGNATSAYVNQELSYLNTGKIKRLKIAADPANAMGSLYLTELFQRIECDPIKINWELNGNMPVHEANPLKLETLQQLQAVIKNEQADIGIATDGDGDRIAFLDEQANPIPADIAAGLVAQTLLKKYPGEKVGYDLRSSRVLPEMIREAGGIPVETRVGHSFVKALMREQNILFAAELSGHYYFRENYNCESPVFVTAELLLLRSLEDKPLSQIWKPYQKYFHSGEINFEVAHKEAAFEKLEKKYAAPPAGGKISKLDGLKIDYPDWWFNARPSANDPMLRLNLEAVSEEIMKEKLAEISAIINS